MKVVCISKFNYYHLRIKPVMDYFEKCHNEVIYLTGNYDTMTREHYVLNEKNVQQLHVIPYYKNISFQRIYSHWHFAKQIYKQLLAEQPDVIYAMVPPNFMAYYIGKYRRKFPNTKIIFDVFDMWPETFPNSRIKPLLAIPFFCWAFLRTHGLKQANQVLTECNLFNTHLKALGHSIVDTLYPFKEKNNYVIDFIPDEYLHLCYLGSINNIIDIDRLTQLLRDMQHIRPVHLHVIGNGEKKDLLLSRMDKIGVLYTAYGNVYDDAKKQEIFNRCAFGINVLKSSVFIGLTLKNIDYFNGGLPILNTVPGDTTTWVCDYQVGVNINDEHSVERILNYSREDILAMKYRARALYDQFLSKEHYQHTLQTILERVIHE